ncbi:MAG: tyrosine-type recombinase/integrase [Nitrospina sp.]|jgi:integrase|nr:tyrosine-type recombinase/integrase [Nitrospina sp.]
MKFTDKSIKALKPKSDRYEAWEDNGKGFGIRVSPTGVKSWIFIYRFDGLARRMTLGRYPAMTLAEAHTVHAKANEQFGKGTDPGVLRTQANSDHRGSPTVTQLVDEYIEKWAKPRKRTWEEDARMLSKDVIPYLGRRKAKDIKRRDIILLIDEIVDRGSPIAANRTLRIIRKMFSFAVKRGVLDASPCIEIDAPAKENQRERVLTEDEIKMFWFGLDNAKMSDGTKLALKLLLVTAQRKGEVTQAEWSEFDLKKGWWTIPKVKSKNERTHRVPLSKMAIDILKQAKEISEDSIWIFPSTKGRSITPRSISRAVRNNSKKKSHGSPKHTPPYGDFFNIDHFTPHDLRRTATSMMTSLKIAELDVSKVLNHTIQTVTSKHYNLYSYDNEKQSALRKWGRRLEAIIGGKTQGKIIQLQK